MDREFDLIRVGEVGLEPRGESERWNPSSGSLLSSQWSCREWGLVASPGIRLFFSGHGCPSCMGFCKSYPHAHGILTSTREHKRN